MLALVLNCIDRLNDYNSAAHFAGISREEHGTAWKQILNLLYKLLGKFFNNLLMKKKGYVFFIFYLLLHCQRILFVLFILSCKLQNFLHILTHLLQRTEFIDQR